ncbi:MAG: fumarylacetoacetate hydrolase family protein [Actinomycetota bacterium]
MGFRLANVDGRAVLVDGEHYHDLEAASRSAIDSDPMTALARLAAVAEVAAGLSDRQPTGALSDVVLGPPVPQPQKSFGIGLNYGNHAAESNMEVPENPVVFTKFPSCLCGPTADVELRSNACDYEGELMVVIGPGGKDIDEADAWSHVAGLMVGQDISDRKAQFMAKPPQFALGKSFDTFGPTGPWLTSLDLVDDPSDLAIEVAVNGEIRQADRTANLIFDVPTLIARLSRIMTLTTGDLLFTGTPAGVGAASGTFLADGDVITTTIEGLGTMTNRCVRISDH